MELAPPQMDSPRFPSERWASLLDEDPQSWLLTASDPAARWATLTGLLDLPLQHPALQQAHEAVLDDVCTQALIARVPDWEADNHLSGHESPAFAPNLLHLLADRGLQPGDDAKVEHVLDQMLEHQSPSGRFMSYGSSRMSPVPVWGSLLCDTHAITEVLVRFGRGEDPRVQTALSRMHDDLTMTAQGRAWPCLPDPATGFRGPGRKGDVCPQVTLEALRTFGRLPEIRRPTGLRVPARVLLRVWEGRGVEQPYMFGHGSRFKTVKWPTTWYGVANVLDALGRFPELWRAQDADPADRRALAELAACLLAYNFDQRGRVTPGSVYRGFEEFSFGQKKQPSAYATAHLLIILRRFDELTEDISAVDCERWLALGVAPGRCGHRASAARQMRCPPPPRGRTSRVR
jgi:hypothetical protein